MNANELADYWSKFTLSENAEETATMLRQQQAEIDKLQYELKQWKALSNFDAKTLEDCNTVIGQQQAEIEALKKQLEASELLNYNKGHEDGRNLVTVKTLTDEEIDKLIHIKGVLFEEGNGYLTLHRYNFARAILRKAQEK